MAAKALAVLMLAAALTRGPSGHGCPTRTPEGSKSPTAIPGGRVEYGPSHGGHGMEAGMYDEQGNYVFADGSAEPGREGAGVGGSQYGTDFWVGVLEDGQVPGSACLEGGFP